MESTQSIVLVTNVYSLCKKTFLGSLWNILVSSSRTEPLREDYLFYIYVKPLISWNAVELLACNINK